MQSPLLTIGIPSYNRAPIVAANLAGIINRLPEWVEVLLCDNASDPPIKLDAETLAIAGQRRVRIRVHRQVTNLGAPANILRLFELVETKWLLLTGDDDPVLPERLPDILDLLERRQDCPIVKFSSPYGGYGSEQVVTDFEGLMQGGGNFNQLLFMSSFLYEVEACRPFLRFAYMMAISAASQLALMIMASLANRPIVLSPLVVTRAREGEPAWSPADARLNFYTLADLPLSSRQRRLLRAKIYGSHNVFREALDLAAIAAVNKQEASYLRRKARSIHRIHGSGAKRLAAQLLLAVSPWGGTGLLAVLKALYARTKGQPYRHTFVSRHDRL